MSFSVDCPDRIIVDRPFSINVRLSAADDFDDVFDIAVVLQCPGDPATSAVLTTEPDMSSKNKSCTLEGVIVDEAVLGECFAACSSGMPAYPMEMELVVQGGGLPDCPVSVVVACSAHSAERNQRSAQDNLAAILANATRPSVDTSTTAQMMAVKALRSAVWNIESSAEVLVAVGAAAVDRIETAASQGEEDIGLEWVGVLQTLLSNPSGGLLHRCGRCRQQVDVSEGVTLSGDAGGGVFHASCLCCAACTSPIAVGSEVLLDSVTRNVLHRGCCAGGSVLSTVDCCCVVRHPCDSSARHTVAVAVVSGLVTSLKYLLQLVTEAPNKCALHDRILCMFRRVVTAWSPSLASSDATRTTSVADFLDSFCSV